MNTFELIQVKEKSYPGYGVRRDLKRWSDRVLQTANADENGIDMDLVDAEQIDLGDEGASKEPQAKGLGAELRAHWVRTVEEELEARLAVVRLCRETLKDGWKVLISCM